MNRDIPNDSGETKPTARLNSCQETITEPLERCVAAAVTTTDLRSIV